MATAITRSEAVLSTTPSGLKPLDISDEIQKIRPAQSTLITLLNGLGKVTVDSRIFKINQQEMDPSTATITNVSTNDLTFSTDDAKAIRVGQTIRLNSTVSSYVTAVNYGTGVVTVASGTGFSNSDVVILGPTGFEENSSRPTVWSRAPVQYTNYVETIRDAYGQSRWVETEKHYGPARQTENRELAMWEHKRALDRALWFGKNVGTGITQNSSQLYKTSGILELVTTNRAAFGSSTISFEKMRLNIANQSRFMPSPTLWLFVSRKGSYLIDMIAYAKHVPTTVDQEFGIMVKRLTLGNKRIAVMECDHFENGMETVMVLIDPSVIEIVTTRNQVTGQRQWCMEEKDARTPGQDGTIGVITTDIGLRIKQEQACAIWTAASSYA